jgi:hypothetical protein
MRAGNLKWVGLIQNPPSAKLAGGTGDPTAWTTYATRRIHLEEVPGGKADDGVGQKQSNRYFRAEIRKDTSVTTLQRIVITGEPYDGLIMYVQNAMHDKQKTELLLCVRKNG